MAPNTHVPAEQLEADIRDGTIDTVVVAFADHHGRLIGKRSDADFCLDVVADHGTENCDYLIACDLDDVPIPGFAWASYDQGGDDCRRPARHPRADRAAGAVRHHVLHHAEFEWQAFNATVTDWERHRYFERI